MKESWLINGFSLALIRYCSALIYGFLRISVLMKRMAVDSAFSSKARRINLYLGRSGFRSE